MRHTRPFRRRLFLLLALTVLLSAEACTHHSTLHASHGLRAREVMTAQQTPRASARPIVIRGEEASRLIARHDKALEQEVQVSRQTASQASLGAGMMSH